MGDYFAKDFSLAMGLVDLLPVILFALAGCIIIKELFSKLRKPFAVLMCSGVTLSLTAGIFKAIWKILLALNVCDFYPFNIMFMPTQSLGFRLMGDGLISLLFKEKKDNKVNVSVLPMLFVVMLAEIEPVVKQDGDMMFIIMLVIGEIMIATSMCYLAVKNKMWLPLVLFIVSFICLMVMGAMKPLSKKLELDVTASNWIEQGINIVAQISLLVGCYILSRKGFFAYKEVE